MEATDELTRDHGSTGRRDSHLTRGRERSCPPTVAPTDTRTHQAYQQGRPSASEGDRRQDRPASPDEHFQHDGRIRGRPGS
jgi:hypothetical protein